MGTMKYNVGIISYRSTMYFSKPTYTSNNRRLMDARHKNLKRVGTLLCAINCNVYGLFCTFIYNFK